MLHEPIDRAALKVIAFILIAVFIIALSSCHTSKQIDKSTTTVDSTVFREKVDSIRVLLSDISRLESQIHELQFAGVYFDSSKCPPRIINVPANCNVDSILQILDQYKNQVRILANGTIEAQGQLRSAFYTKDKLTIMISELQHTVDSLSAVKQKENIQYQEKTVTTTKYIERSVFTQWWLWLIFFVGGCIVDRKWLSKLKIF